MNRAVIIFLLLAVVGFAKGAAAAGSLDGSWVGTWASSQQLVEPHNMPPHPGLAYNTLRQVVRVSIGGELIRLKLSNEYGNGPLEIKAVHLAQAAGAHRIKPETGLIITFNGEQAVTIPPGETVISDPMAYSLPSLTAVAITIHFGAVPSALTGHPGSRTTSYISTDSAVDPEWMRQPVPTEHWYVINGIDVAAGNPNSAAVVVIGDSITDGRGSTTDRHNRWPDILAERLQANEATAHIGVLNHGIGGNAVLAGGLGPTVSAALQPRCFGAAGCQVCDHPRRSQRYRLEQLHSSSPQSDQCLPAFRRTGPRSGHLGLRRHDSAVRGLSMILRSGSRRGR